MNENQIRIGIKIICGWISLCLFMNTMYILLVNLGIVNDEISSSDYLVMVSSIILTITVLVGLWHHKSWAWRLFIVGTFLSWLYTLIYIIKHYTFGIGLIFSVVGFVLSGIFWFLFQTEVKNVFAIYKTKFKHMEWTVDLLFFISFYFMALDILGGLFALLPTIVIITAVVVYRKSGKRDKFE